MPFIDKLMIILILLQYISVFKDDMNLIILVKNLGIFIFLNVEYCFVKR